jgi:hypothetical protein
MLANELMVDAYGRTKQIVHRVVEGLSKEQLSYRPTDDANTIAWLIWHLARIQDDHIAGLAKSKQVWEKWYDKFGLPFDKSATGYGQSSEEVAQVNPSAELLLGYFDAVHSTSIKYLGTLKEADYQKVVDHNWDPPVTLAVRLVSVLSDNLQHAGQAAFVKGLYDKT